MIRFAYPPLLSNVNHIFSDGVRVMADDQPVTHGDYMKVAGDSGVIKCEGQKDYTLEQNEISKKTHLLVGFLRDRVGIGKDQGR